MKRFAITFLAVVIIIATIANSSALAAATAKYLSTNFTLVNLGDQKTTVSVDYLLQNGSPWPNVKLESLSFDLDANGGQNQIRQYADTMDAGAGSAVVSSSQPLGAVVQIQARNQTPTMGAYIGASTGSDTFYVPLVAHRAPSASGTANSQIIIQNAGTGLVNVEVVLKPITGFTKTYTKTITNLAQGASFYYDLETELNLEDPGVTTAWFGSAEVHATTAGGSLVVVSNLFFGANGLQTFNAFAKETLTNKWLVPIFTSKLSNGLTTVVTIQNLSGGDLLAGDVTLTCSHDPAIAPATFTKTNPDVIADRGGYSFNPVNSVDLPDGYPFEWAGSCKVETPVGKNIVAMVQMRYINRPVNNTATYEAIPANGTKTSAFAPLIAARLSNGFATVVNIANLSDQPNTVRLVYTPSKTECPVAICDRNSDGVVDALDAFTVTPDITIDPEAGIQRNHRNPGGEPGLPVGWVGSLSVTSQSGLPIGGIVQLTNVFAASGDTLMAHGMFGK